MSVTSATSLCRHFGDLALFPNAFRREVLDVGPSCHVAAEPHRDRSSGHFGQASREDDAARLDGP
jgi:hypothetical protein